MSPRIWLPSRSPSVFPWSQGCSLVWLVSGWAYLRPSAKKMIFLSRTAEAKIWIICSKWRQCSRTLKSTCSRWESRGRVSEMNYRKTREKGFSNKRKHRPRAGLSHCFHGTDLILAHPSVASFCSEDSWVRSSLWLMRSSLGNIPIHMLHCVQSKAELFSCLKPGLS